MAGLEPVTVTDVGDLPPVLLSTPAVLALFTIGETPFDAEQRQAIEDVLARRSPADPGRPLGHRRLPRLGGLRHDCWAPASTGTPGPSDFEIEVVDGTTRPPPTSGAAGPGTTRSTSSVSCAPTPGCCLAVADGQLDLTVPGGRRPECGFPLAWCLEEGGGRTFYTALGHFPGPGRRPAYLRHLAGGLQWLLGGP